MSGQTQPRKPIAVTATFTLPSMTVISGPPFTVQPGGYYIEWTPANVQALIGGLPVYDEAASEATASSNTCNPCTSPSATVAVGGGVWLCPLIRRPA